jgi:hypothetical protein
MTFWYFLQVADVDGEQKQDAKSVQKPRSPLAPSLLESYLEQIDASPGEPTPQDLLNLKPEISAPIESAEYAHAYKSSLRRVSRAFTYQQMVQLANLLGVDSQPRISRQLAAVLLERSWGWINPASARKLKEKPQSPLRPVRYIPSCHGAP